MRCSTSAIVSAELSRRRASSACRSGATARFLSCSSRAAMSRFTSSKFASMPFSRSSAVRRLARTSTLAVRNTFASAFGSTTVPMSRPSITTGSRAAISRSITRTRCRTASSRANALAALPISSRRISALTSRPSTKTCCTPSAMQRSSRRFGAALLTAALSSGEIPCSSSESAAARNSAPVST